MALYKQIDMSPRLLPVVLEDQSQPGSFAHALHQLVDLLDISAFDAHVVCKDKNTALAGMKQKASAGRNKNQTLEKLEAQLRYPLDAVDGDLAYEQRCA